MVFLTVMLLIGTVFILPTVLKPQGGVKRLLDVAAVGEMLILSQVLPVNDMLRSAVLVAAMLYAVVPIITYLQQKKSLKGGTRHATGGGPIRKG
ncbi:MAG: hypothetical protein ABF743_03160 [Schleiferilactobacillus perolens]|uniref:hypothetical protein n=1 Tax=Schleiferilactobacillus perolens TaxID=100468 RepID=UPI0039E8CE9B